MFRKREKKEEQRGPAETCQLSENVEGQLWIKTRQDGERRIDVSLGRINPTGRSFRTFRIRDLTEFPSALANLMGALSKVPDQPRELREQLSYMSDLLTKVADAGHLVPLKAVNGHDDDAGEPRIFS